MFTKPIEYTIYTLKCKKKSFNINEDLNLVQRVMSGLNNDEDEALDNVDSLISRIKGNKKSEEPQVQKSSDSPLKASPAGGSSASGDW